MDGSCWAIGKFSIRFCVYFIGWFASCVRISWCDCFLFTCIIPNNSSYEYWVRVFNLIPLPPLDGSKVLMGILPEETYFKLMQYEMYFFFRFAAASIYWNFGCIIKSCNFVHFTRLFKYSRCYFRYFHLRLFGVFFV